MQFSLFGATVAEPCLDDLAGIVLAGGDWVRADNSQTARLSVVVDGQWRVDALGEAFAELELEPSVGPAENGTGVRTGFSARLAPEAARWTRGAVLRAPAGLLLTARGLRLWAIASGRADGGGYLFGTAEPDDELHRIGRLAVGPPRGDGNGDDVSIGAGLAGDVGQAVATRGRTPGSTAAWLGRRLAGSVGVTDATGAPNTGAPARFWPVTLVTMASGAPRPGTTRRNIIKPLAIVLLVWSGTAGQPSGAAQLVIV